MVAGVYSHTEQSVVAATEAQMESVALAAALWKSGPHEDLALISSVIQRGLDTRNVIMPCWDMFVYFYVVTTQKDETFEPPLHIQPKDCDSFHKNMSSSSKIISLFAILIQIFAVITLTSQNICSTGSKCINHK